MARLLFALLLLALASPSRAEPLLRLTLSGRTVHNSHYLAASLRYQLRVLLAESGGDPSARFVRRGQEHFLDLAGLTPEQIQVIRDLASRWEPRDELDRAELNEAMQEVYYRLTSPFPNLSELLKAHPYRENPDWLRIPVQSAVFRRTRVLHVQKDRIADALESYFEHQERVVYPAGTLIVAESLNREGRFVEAEVLRKRADGLWDFAAYDEGGQLLPSTVAFDENGEPDATRPGFAIPSACALCHRDDRLDFSGDAEFPAPGPIRGFFHKLPGRVPQIELGIEHHDYQAFTELTETFARVKDGVFGVYGSLLLSELAGRQRLGTLSESDRRRYERLQPLYPELLGPIDATNSFVNSIGMKLMRIPASRPSSKLGSPRTDPEHRADEERHPAGISRPYFLGMHEVTNAQFRRFRPEHRSEAFRGIELDGAEQPVVGVSHAEALAFVAWLNEQPAEVAARRRYRLPTEAEWEWAARGGDERRFPWGDAWPPPPGSGNFGDEASATVLKVNWPFLHHYQDGHVGTAPVGSFPPNPYFLYDMAGNVYEWTDSVYEPYTDKSGPAPGPKPYGAPTRVTRGSSWGDELPKVLRCAFRNPFEPEIRLAFLGFRVAADLESAPDRATPELPR